MTVSFFSYHETIHQPVIHILYRRRKIVLKINASEIVSMKRLYASRVCAIWIDWHANTRRSAICTRIGSKVFVEATIFLHNDNDMLYWIVCRSNVCCNNGLDRSQD